MLQTLSHISFMVQQKVFHFKVFAAAMPTVKMFYIDWTQHCKDMHQFKSYSKLLKVPGFCKSDQFRYIYCQYYDIENYSLFLRIREIPK